MILRELVPAVKKRLKEEIIRMIEKGVTEFCAGGALGFDTMAAQIVLALKQQYSSLRLTLILPCRGQDDRWSDQDRQVYRKILEDCDEAFYVSEKYSPRCMLARNRAMAQKSAHCICYLSNGAEARLTRWPLRRS